MPLATPQSGVGIALEATRGTVVDPTFFIPVDTNLDIFDNVMYLQDHALRGSMARTFSAQKGVSHSEINFGNAVYLDSFGFPLTGVLGDVSWRLTRKATDGVTNTDTSLTSATAAFTSADVGCLVTGSGIYPGTTIASVSSGTAVVLSHATTASASGVTFYITGRAVADGVTNGTTTVTSATAAFTAADVNCAVSGTDIPAGAYIVSVTNGTTIVISAAATGSHTGNTLTIGAGAPFTTYLSVQNSLASHGQPPSYTVTDFYGIASNGGRQYGYGMFSDVTMTFNADGFLTYTTKAMAFPSASDETPDFKFTTIQPEAAWEGSTTIASSSNATLETGTFTFSRTVTPNYTVNGVQHPYTLWAGTYEQTAKCGFIIDDDTEYTRYLNNTQPAFDVTFTRGVGSAYLALGIHMSQAAYVTGKPAVRSKDYVTAEFDITGIANGTDKGVSGGLSPVKVTLTNAVPPGIYSA